MIDEAYMYSFGIKSPIKFYIETELAEAINRTTRAILETWGELEIEHDSIWSIDFVYSPWYQLEWEITKDWEAFAGFLGYLNGVIYKYGIDEYERAYKGTYLVCNNPPLIGPRSPNGAFYSDVEMQWTLDGEKPW